MKASPTPTASRRSACERLERRTVGGPSGPSGKSGTDLVDGPLDVFEGAQAAGDQQVGDHDDDRDEGEGGGERQVVDDVVEDDVADELVVGDEARGDVVAQRQREGEDRACLLYTSDA